MTAGVVAVIPARAGSKRIPGKNIKPFNGQPMIAWSIRAARLSGLFERIVVTTDSEEIVAIATEHGAECPFRRPADLADDHTPTAPVVRHALQWLLDQGQRVDAACCLYATAPFVQAGDLRTGYETLTSTGCGAAFTVSSYGSPIFRALKVTEDGSLAMFQPQYELTRSQDLPEAYFDAGQFYWLDGQRFMRDVKLYTADARPVILPRWRVQDIDTMEDWTRASLMHRMLTEQGMLS